MDLVVEDKSVYKWEKNLTATWEAVQEDEQGNLIHVSNERERSHRAKQ
jgi:hypothetical protein